MVKKIFRFLRFPLLLISILTLAYLLGPSPKGIKSFPAQSATASPLPAAQLAAQISATESAIPNLKPGNAAKVIWANPSNRKKTPYSIVYLHGFSSSHREGYPVHEQVAEYYGCNLYLSRLEGHGLSGDSIFQNLTPTAYVASAVEALNVGKQLGEKVILMGTSTGGSLALYLAANDPEIAAVLLYSPLIDFFRPEAYLISKPWGIFLGRTIIGSQWVEWTPKNPEQEMYWSTRYRVEGLAALAKMAEDIATPETFEAVKCPLMLNYYYRDEVHQDSTVSVMAMQKMFAQVGTPTAQKRQIAYPDAGSHVITSELTSGAWEAVRDSTLFFLGNSLNLFPADELPDELLQRGLSQPNSD